MITKSGLIVISMILALGCQNDHKKIMGNFQGMWKLDKYQSFNSTSGQWHDAKSRLGYSGYIIYDGNGHMGVQLIPKVLGR